MAKLAVTPPVVGSVSTTMKGRPASLTNRVAITLRGICIRLMAPSCMRAPPDAVNTISGASCNTASLAAATSASPTPAPIEPPMNSNAIAATTTLWPSMAPEATRMASSRCVLSRASFSRSAYRLESRKRSGSAGTFGSSIRVKPSSSVHFSRSVAVARKWWPHWLQTFSVVSKS